MVFIGTSGLIMKQAKTLNEKEIKSIFAQIATRRHSVRDRAIFAISFYAGLRAHEIASLNIDNIVSADGSIRDEIILSSNQTKGSQSRKVFISDRLRKELAAYVKSIGQRRQNKRSLFMTQKDNAFTANAMCHLFKDIYEDCGIENASSHSGRRTFITNLASKGVGVRVLAALAGHASISTTQRYIDINDHQLRSAVELM